MNSTDILRDMEVEDAEQISPLLMTEKIAHDIYYRELYSREGEAATFAAGYFQDNDPRPFDLEKSLDIMCTPALFMRKELHRPNPCVLLGTGCYSPVHEGHIQMMEHARTRAEEAGYSVIGGFMAPDHDSYASGKPGGVYYGIHYRLHVLRQAIEKHDWLRADPWMALFRSYDVNFTEPLARLERYIERHLGVKVPVFLVVGSDNAGFAATFKYERDYMSGCIVIGREGYAMSTDALDYLEHFCSAFSHSPMPRIMYTAQQDLPSYHSTQLRLAAPQEQHKVSLPGELLLRVESDDPLHTAICAQLRERFSIVIISKVDDQRSRVYAEWDKLPYPVISLDPLLPGAWNLEISRDYDFGGIDMLGYTNRPGSLPLTEQIEQIPPGRYIVYDDDVHTGNTVSYVKKRLAARGIEVECSLSFTCSTSNQEVLDCRDFIYGAKDGGLVVGGVRVPYVYPFVDPLVRASVSDPMEFSKAIWDINLAHQSPGGTAYSQCKNYRGMLLD